MAKKILITGITSRVGTRLKEEAVRQGYVVVGVSRKMASERRISLDLTIKDQVLAAVKEERPWCVVHAAAMTDVDLCEKDKEQAWLGNVVATENIAEASRVTGARLINISTDYVFDGENGPYGETSSPGPINVYGSTKLEAEKKTKEICPDALTLRICVPYDWNQDAAPNFLMWLIEKLQAGSHVKIVTDQWNTPTYIPHLAQVILKYCGMKKSGIAHVSGRDFLSRYDFAMKVCKIFDFDDELVQPCGSDEFKQAARRPMKAGLKVDQAEKSLKLKMLTVKEGLELAKQSWKFGNAR